MNERNCTCSFCIGYCPECKSTDLISKLNKPYEGTKDKTGTLNSDCVEPHMEITCLACKANFNFEDVDWAEDMPVSILKLLDTPHM